jgi:hypothetical protein
MLDVEHVEKTGEVQGMVLNRTRPPADIRKTVAAFIVKNNEDMARQPLDDVAPDTEIRADRIR